MRRTVAIAVALQALAGPARAAGRDPWLGRDKALHFVASFSIAGSTYALASAATSDRPRRLVAAFGVAFAVGLAKEGLDALGFGDASRRDLTWDAVGSAMGAAAAWGVERLLSPAPPAAVWSPPGPLGWARLDPRTPLVL